MERIILNVNTYDYTKIISIDKLTKGEYKILLDDGSEILASLDHKNFISLITKIRHYQERLLKEINDNAAQLSELKSSAPHILSNSELEEGPLDIYDEPFLPSYGLSEAQCNDPDYNIILVSDKDRANRLMLGAVDCTWGDIVGGESILKNLTVGESNSFDSQVRWEELSLMKVKKSVSEKHYKYWQSQQNTPYQMEADYKERGGMTVNYGGVSGEIKTRREIVNGKY